MPKLNWEIVHYNITEAREQLEKIEQLISRNELSEIGLQADLEHAFHHLSFAWNIRHVSSKRYAKMSDEDFNMWSKFPAELEAYNLNT